MEGAVNVQHSRKLLKHKISKSQPHPSYLLPFSISFYLSTISIMYNIKDTEKSQPSPSFSNYQYITNYVSVIPSSAFWIIFKQTSDSHDSFVHTTI